MKKYLLIFIVIFAVAAYFLLFSKKEPKPPEEYRLNRTHVSDRDESLKFSERKVGGNCYLASTTMMLKSLDPSIEFWQVVVAQGNSTSFSFYFPKGNESEIKEGFAGGGTELALKAIKNMGYQPHVRLQALPFFNQNNSWLQIATKLGGDAKTYLFAPPMNEYKSIIASGIPLVAAGSPCWRDYNVIEGYSKDNLFVVVPDPDDEDRTDPKISCPTGGGLEFEVFWATPQDKQMHHSKILADMKSYALEAPDNLFKYADYLQKGSSIVDFQIEKLYLARLFASKYLEERGYKELAAGYEKSASLFEELTQFIPSSANEHKEKVIKTIREIASNEESLLSRW